MNIDKDNRSNECWPSHTAAWRGNHWERMGLVDVDTADNLENSWQHWPRFERARNPLRTNMFPSDEEVLELDGGRYLGLVRMIGRRM